MGKYYLYKDTQLYLTGECPDGMEQLMEKGEYLLGIGDPPQSLLYGKTVEDYKKEKNNQINSWRLQANRGTFQFAGKIFSCDELSRSDIDGFNGIVSLLGELPPNWLGAWKAVDNSYLPITDVATWSGLYAAMVAQGQSNFIHSQELKAQLAVATTVEEVNAITW